MGIQAPDPLAKFFLWFVGMEFPGLDEDKLLRMAEGLADLVREYGAAEKSYKAGVNKIKGNSAGKAQRKFVESSESLLGVLGKGGDYTSAVGWQHHVAAGMTFSTKVTAITSAALLLVELLFAAQVFWYNPIPWVKFWAQAPANRALLRVFLQQVAARSALLAREAAEEAMQELISALAGELAAVKKGYKPGKVDVKDVGKSTGAGAMAGGLMGVFGPAAQAGFGKAAKSAGIDKVGAELAKGSTPARVLVEGVEEAGESAVSAGVEVPVEGVVTVAAGGEWTAGAAGVTFVSSMAFDAVAEAGAKAADKVKTLVSGPGAEKAAGGGSSETTVSGDGTPPEVGTGASIVEVEPAPVPGAAGVTVTGPSTGTNGGRGPVAVNGVPGGGGAAGGGGGGGGRAPQTPPPPPGAGDRPGGGGPTGAAS
ncbi:hypothetical protein AB0J86_33410, partial [Micromonospora sp. NPDC049559]